MSRAKLLFPEMRFFSFLPKMAPKREPKRSKMKLEILFCRSLGGSVLEKGGARKRFTRGSRPGSRVAGGGTGWEDLGGLRSLTLQSN